MRSAAASVPAPAGSTSAARLGAALSALWFVGSVDFFIWVVQPLRQPLLAAGFMLYIVLLAVAVNIRAGESPRDVGFRVDDLGRAVRVALPPTLALALLTAIGAVVVAGHPRPRALAAGLVLYPLWGLTQQYALQGIVHRRLLRAGTGALASPLAAALFALVHAPNPGLMAMTFVGGWVWCEIYRREPNLWVLGVSHGVLATLVLALLPLRVTGELRIGPGYLEYVARHGAHGAPGMHGTKGTRGGRGIHSGRPAGEARASGSTSPRAGALLAASESAPTRAGACAPARASTAQTGWPRCR